MKPVAGLKIERALIVSIVANKCLPVGIGSRTIPQFYRRSPGLEARGSPMKYGMNLLLWTTHVTPEIYPTIAKIKKTGFDGVEVPVFEGELSHYKEVAKELKNQGIACSSTVTVATEAANPISPDAALREAGLERLRWAIDVTATLGGQYLCGPYHSPLAVFSGQGPTADEKKRAADVLRKAAEHAQKA